MDDTLNRRDFLKLVGAASGGLILAVYLDGCMSALQEVVVVPTTAGDPATPRTPFNWEPNYYLKMDQDGTLTVIAFRSEMGQGIRTALAMLVAEELDVEWSAVRIEQAPADQRYGDQVTGGSVSISKSYNIMRMAGGIARRMLVKAAARIWSADEAQCSTENRYVFHPDGTQKLFYGDLVQAASQMNKPNQANLKEKIHFKIVGKGTGHWDAPMILTGKAVYGMDVRIPGMLFAALARCPVFGGTIESYDDISSQAVPGVRQVVPLKDCIAVVADNSWAAIQGRKALKIMWKEGDNATLSSEELIASALKDLPTPGSTGNSIKAVYRIPYEAHATMEPMNCTAFIHDGMCEVWAPTQSPQEVQQAVAAVTGISKGKVIVNVPLIGGGFGRRLQTDYAREAALVSKAVNAPVQVLWTRDDDMQHDFYHPMSVQYFKANLDELRLPIALTSGGRAVPTGPWRSVNNFTKAYGEQCFIDEMAVALKRDPLDLRLELYQNNKRAMGVIRLAAEKAEWGRFLSPGSGQGMAYYATFGVTHAAQVVELTVYADGKVRVQRVVCAVDCGTVVNPDNVAAQMEGGIVFGLTAALKAEVTIKDGRVQQGNFHDYPIWRMDEMPVVEVHTVPSDERPSGIGEMGVPPIAPAVANAVFAATGKRIRHIPIRPEDLRI